MSEQTPTPMPLSEQVRALKRIVVAEHNARVEALAQQVAEMEEKLTQAREALEAARSKVDWRIEDHNALMKIDAALAALRGTDAP